MTSVTELFPAARAASAIVFNAARSVHACVICRTSLTIGEFGEPVLRDADGLPLF